MGGRTGVTARAFSLPDLGEGLTDAEVARWLVAVGDPVEVDQPLVEVVTAKATVELPSPYAGVVTELHCVAGEVVEVGRTLVSITEAVGGEAGGETPGEMGGETPGEMGPAGSSEAGPAGSNGAGQDEGRAGVLVGYGKSPAPSRRPRHGPGRRGGGAGGAPVGAQTGRHQGEVPAVISPVVRRLARQEGIDLNTLAGSGPRGLIQRSDVEAVARERRMPATRSNVAAGTAAGENGAEAATADAGMALAPA
ncbi:MAG: biotin/lipoyl-containing protein, partial [Acidimicrobiales bacterium]